jgi:hypothetical protein
MASPISPHSATRHASTIMCGGFTYHTVYTLGPVLPLTGWASLLRHPIAYLLPDQAPRSPPPHPKVRQRLGRLVSPGSVWALFCGHGNINPLSIDYACRPRLRSRLTLGGLTCPRNPWSSGGRVSHSAFATHACILTRAASTTRSLGGFTAGTTLPYPSKALNQPQRAANVFSECHSFGG